MQTPVKKKGDSHLKAVVTGVFIYWILFIIVTWITFWVKDAIPDTLVEVGLGGSALELVCTAIIQVAKKKYEPEEKGENENYG